MKKLEKLEKLSVQIDQCLTLAAGDEMLTMLLSMASLEVSRRIEARSVEKRIVPCDTVTLMRAAGMGRG